MQKIAIASCVALLTLLFVTPAPAEEATHAAKNAGPIFGYLDPKNDTFTPAVQPKPATPAATMLYRKGILEITATIAITASVAKSTTFSVSVDASTRDPTYTTTVSTGGAINRSGNTGKITFKLPYLFTLSSAKDSVSIDLNIYSSTGESVSSTQTIPLPANNATTVVNIGERV